MILFASRSGGPGWQGDLGQGYPVAGLAARPEALLGLPPSVIFVRGRAIATRSSTACMCARTAGARASGGALLRRLSLGCRNGQARYDRRSGCSQHELDPLSWRLGFEQVAHFREVGKSSIAGSTSFFCSASWVRPVGTIAQAGRDANPISFNCSKSIREAECLAASLSYQVTRRRDFLRGYDRNWREQVAK